jgi:hypothetical protein
MKSLAPIFPPKPHPQLPRIGPYRKVVECIGYLARGEARVLFFKLECDHEVVRVDDRSGTVRAGAYCEHCGTREGRS